MRIPPYLILLAVFFGSLVSAAERSLSLELGPVWQSRNDVRIPSKGGTDFSLRDADSGPFFAGRIYGRYDIDERHGLRLLIAPFNVEVRGTYSQNIAFAGQNFSAGTPVTGSYRFNSYRLTYRYAFFLDEEWELRVGFTAKIRDARIALTQGNITAESTNVGFVPLLHFAALYRLGEAWFLSFDLDGLAAPQGRAFDAIFQAGYQATPWLDVTLGYRTLEGGAENETIRNFTWLHYAVAGATLKF